MAISELLAIVPPPRHPLDEGSLERWPQVVDELGYDLPTDLRDIGIHYGTGRFANGEIEIFNPFSPNYQNLVELTCEGVREFKEGSGEVPYDVFPKTPGLYAWGRDTNGHKMYWLRDREPETWKIVINDPGVAFEEWEMSLSEFLAKAFSNRIRTIITAPRFSKTECTFHRGRNQAEVYEEMDAQEKQGGA